MVVDGVLRVSTGYSAETVAAVTDAAATLGLSIEEFQRTGVYVVDFLTKLGGEDTEPLRPRPPSAGEMPIVTAWTVGEDEVVLRSVGGAYDLTDAEAQVFGTVLLTFFVGLSGG